MMRRLIIIITVLACAQALSVGPSASCRFAKTHHVRQNALMRLRGGAPLVQIPGGDRTVLQVQVASILYFVTDVAFNVAPNIFLKFFPSSHAKYVGDKAPSKAAYSWAYWFSIVGLTLAASHWFILENCSASVQRKFLKYTLAYWAIYGVGSKLPAIGQDEPAAGGLVACFFNLALIANQLM